MDSRVIVAISPILFMAFIMTLMVFSNSSAMSACLEHDNYEWVNGNCVIGDTE